MVEFRKASYKGVVVKDFEGVGIYIYVYIYIYICNMTTK